MGEIKQKEIINLEAEHRHMAATMRDIADNVKKLTDFMVEQTAQARVNSEIFLRIQQQIDESAARQRKQERIVTALTTEVIPEIEKEAAIKGAFWKMVGAVSIPLATAIASIIWAFGRYNQKATVELSMLRESIETLIKAIN